MDIALFASRLLLAVVFLTSGLSKLPDRAATTDAARAFGLPEGMSRLAGRALPMFELVLGMTLIVPRVAVIASLFALALLGAFTVLLLRVLRRGDSVRCNCFGSSTHNPVTWRTALRNFSLLGLAGWTVLAAKHAGRLSDWRWLASTGARFVVVLSVGFVVAVGIVARRVWRHRHALEAVDGGNPDGGAPRSGPGLLVGAPSPAFALPALQGGSVSLKSLTDQGRPVALLFMDPACNQCTSLLPDVVEWGHRGEVTVAVVTSVSVEAAAPKFGRLGLPVLTDETLAVGSGFKVTKTPSGVLIAPEGLTVAPLAVGPAAIRALIADSRPATRWPAGPVLSHADA
jgi:uncharacterized membrane protein YphA (DoxX/SURF4 family)